MVETQHEFITVTEIAATKKTAVRKKDVSLFVPWEGVGPDKSQHVGTALWSGINQLEKPLIIVQESYEKVWELMASPLPN